MISNGETRRLKFDILRYNPNDAVSRPKMQRFELDEADGMTL